MSSSELLKLRLSTHYVYDYVASNCEPNEEESQIRDFVKSFKIGDYRAKNSVIRLMTDLLEESFPVLENLVLCCIPASSIQGNADRWEDFSEQVCKQTGMINAFHHMKVTADRPARHLMKRRIPIRNIDYVQFNTEWFNGKQIILIDDVMTNGHSFAVFKETLEGFGAEVIGSAVIAKTDLERLNAYKKLNAKQSKSAAAKIF